MARPEAVQLPFGVEKFENVVEFHSGKYKIYPEYGYGGVPTKSFLAKKLIGKQISRLSAYEVIGKGTTLLNIGRDGRKYYNKLIEGDRFGAYADKAREIILKSAII